MCTCKHVHILKFKFTILIDFAFNPLSYTIIINWVSQLIVTNGPLLSQSIYLRTCEA